MAGATFVNVLDKPYHVVGNQRKTVYDATMDTSYLTGGETWTAAQLGLNHVDHVEGQITVLANSSDTIASAQAIRTNGQGGFIKLYDASPAQLTSGDNVGACVVRLTAYGY